MQQNWQSERMVGRALGLARNFLARWNDPATRNARDDLAQEAVWLALSRHDRVRENCFPALLRTITRRLRHRELDDNARRALVFGGSDDVLDELPARRDRDPCLMVLGHPIDEGSLLRHLEALLPTLGQLNSTLVARFYEGFTCAELGEQYGLSEESVKVRIYRCRERLRERFEAMVRAADGLVD